MTGAQVIYLPGVAASPAPPADEQPPSAEAYHARMQELRTEEREVRPWRPLPA